MIIISIALYLLGIFLIIGAINEIIEKKLTLYKGLSKAFVGLIFLSLGWFVWPSSDSSEKLLLEKQKSSDTVKKIHIEQALASLDAGRMISDTSLKVIRIRTLLNRLSNMYSEPVDSIADFTSKAQGAIHDQGINESCANILENMYLAGKVKGLKYKDAVLVYGYLKSR